MIRLRALALGLLLAAAGCHSAYGGIDMYVVGGDLDAVASPRGVRVSEGGVVVIEANPISAEGHDDYDGLERFELRIADSNLARVRRGVLKDTWVINGLAVGVTRLQVRVDGDLEHLIPLQVAPQ